MLKRAKQTATYNPVLKDLDQLQKDYDARQAKKEFVASLEASMQESLSKLNQRP